SQPFYRLRRTDQASGTAPDGFAPLPHGVAAASRADIGKFVGLAVGGPLFRHDVQDLRDDIAGALDDDSISNANVAPVADRLAAASNAPYVVLVVQRGIGHDHAPHRHRLQTGDRRKRTGAPHLKVAAVEHRHRLFRCKFMRGSPAWAARAEAETLLEVQPVYLVDDAVYVIRDFRTFGLDLVVMRQKLLDRVAAHHAVIDRKAPIAEAPDDVILRLRQGLADLAPRISKKPQGPRAGNLRILLTQASSSAVARICNCLASLGQSLLEGEEIVAAHVDLAAHLDHVGRIVRQGLRNIRYGANVRGDILAGGAIAPGGTGDKPAVLVTQRHGKAVDLRLSREDDLALGREGQEPAHAGYEIAY